MKRTNKMRRICATAILAAMLVGTTTVYAAGITSTLSSNAKTVTSVCNSGSSGYHVVTVKGYEHHPGTGHYNLYTEPKTYSGGGTFTVSHVTHEGYKFETSYSNVTLTATLTRGGVQIGSINVTY